MILITGANGHLGGLIIDSLLAKKTGKSIAALVRTEEKGAALKAKGVELRIGDYTDKAALAQAVKGIDTLLLISSGSLENRVQQHANVIDAAKEAGVGQILYTSITKPSANSKFVSGIDHFHTEKLLVDSGIAYTILRDTFYFEVFPMFLADSLQTGKWFYPSKGAKLNLASRVDMADAVANVLADPEPHRNKTYDLASPVSYTLSEVGEIIAKASGKPFTYVDVTLPDYTDALRGAGVPAEQIPFITVIAEAITLGELDQASTDLEQLLGHEPKQLSEFIGGLVK